MSHHPSPDGQLSVFSILIQQEVSSRTICDELNLKIHKKDPRRVRLSKLDQLARNNKDLELESNQGIWTAQPVGKTATGFYRWNLLLRPTARAFA